MVDHIGPGGNRNQIENGKREKTRGESEKPNINNLA